MGANVGIDCQVALDGAGYWLAPKSYRVGRPRLRRATVLAGGAENYVDAGPGKRVWTFIVLALDGLARYDGRPTGLTGQQYRDALTASYETIGVLPFVDPHGVAWRVRFDHLVESLPDPRTALAGPAGLGPGYLLAVELVEA